MGECLLTQNISKQSIQFGTLSYNDIDAEGNITVHLDFEPTFVLFASYKGDVISYLQYVKGGSSDLVIENNSFTVPYNSAYTQKWWGHS